MSKEKKSDPRVVTLDELTFTVKIDPTLDRKIVEKLIARISGEDKGSFMKEVTNYLKSQMTYGVCGKEDVLVEHNNPIQSL